jgi:hypothetical protein
MPYSIVELVSASDESGRTPDFPEDVTFLELADPGRDANWALYDYQVPEAATGWMPGSPVETTLSRLIDSGKRYPPALALARSDMNDLFREHLPSRSVFLAAYEGSLKKHLSCQHSARYVLAAAVRDEVGYLAVGAWYWLIAIPADDPTVAVWVSGDFHVYRSACSHFDLDNARRELLLR